jgi:hypothetical protein
VSRQLVSVGLGVASDRLPAAPGCAGRPRGRNEVSAAPERRDEQHRVPQRARRRTGEKPPTAARVSMRQRAPRMVLPRRGARGRAAGARGSARRRPPRAAPRTARRHRRPGPRASCRTAFPALKVAQTYASTPREPLTPRNGPPGSCYGHPRASGGHARLPRHPRRGRPEPALRIPRRRRLPGSGWQRRVRLVVAGSHRRSCGGGPCRQERPRDLARRGLLRGAGDGHARGLPRRLLRLT